MLPDELFESIGRARHRLKPAPQHLYMTKNFSSSSMVADLYKLLGLLVGLQAGLANCRQSLFTLEKA